MAITQSYGNERSFTGISKTVKHAITPQEARKQAFDWEPEPFALYNGEQLDTNDPTQGLIESHKGTQRSDTKAQLGIVGKGYKILGNDVMTDLAIATGFNVITAGEIDGGSKVFMQLEMDRVLFPDTDPHSKSLLLLNDHGGNGSLRAIPTYYRFFCQNQMNGINKAANTQIKIKHTTNAMNYVAEARKILAESNAAFSMIDAEIEQLLRGTDYGTAQGMIQMAEAVWGPRPEETGRGLTIWENRIEDLIQIYRSESVANIRGTDYAGVMTINEYELTQGNASPEAEAKRVLGGMKATRTAAQLALA